MNKRRGEHFRHFVEHVRHEFKGAVLARTEFGVRLAVARQFRVGGRRRAAVAGHLDLRQHHNVPIGRVGHDFLELRLRIEPALAR